MVSRKITVDMGSFKVEDMSLAVGKDGTELNLRLLFLFTWLKQALLSESCRKEQALHAEPYSDVIMCVFIQYITACLIMFFNVPQKLFY